MNYQQKNQLRKDFKDLFTPGYPEGCVKITSQETELHAKTKAHVMHWLKTNQYEVWCEATFKNGYSGRPDLICIHPSGVSYIIEVMCSESEIKALEKLNKYPPITIIKVYAKTFDYNTFCL